MASVTFDEAWLHDAGDLDQAVQVVVTGMTERAGRSPDIRNYAGGRRRVVSRPDARHALQVAASDVDRPTIAQLQAWADAGTVLLFRGSRGRVLYGVLQDFRVVEYPGDAADFAALSWTFDTTTDTAAV